MKQYKTKMLSGLLALLMCAPMFAACSEETAVEDNTPAVTNAAEETVVTETEEEEAQNDRLQDNLPEADFDGYDFRILSTVFVGRELATFLVVDEVNGEKVNDAVYNSASAVAERFNVNFNTISVADINAVTSSVRTAVNAGDDAYDIQCGHDTMTVGLSKEGMFYNMYDVPQFDFSQPWWPENIVSQLDMAGKLYVGSNYLTYNGLHWTRVLIANKTAFEDNGLPVPYEMIMDGAWTTDEMYKMVEGAGRDLNGDGKMDDRDFFGFLMGCGVTYCMQDTFGLQFYEESEEGLTMVCDLERVAKFADQMNKFNQNTNDCIYGATSENEFGQKLFMNGQTLLATTMIGTAYDEFREVEFGYSILPFPKLDELQTDYINTCTDAFWAIPITAYPHIDVVGTVIEALSCANYQDVLPVYFESALKTRMADSPEDAAMFDIIRASRTIGFEYAYQMTFSNVYNIFVLENTDPAGYLKRWQKSGQKAADKLFSEFSKLD